MMFYKGKKIYFHSVLLLQICALSSVVSAQQTESSTTTGDKTQAVLVKAKSEEEYARKDTASKSVFGSSDLNKHGDVSIVDALKRLPGISVVDGKLSLPGMSPGYTSILVDGEVPRGLRIEDIPMSTIDRVEIYRLGSAEFNNQAISGTINIIRKKIAATTQNRVKFDLTNRIKPSAQITWLRSEKIGNLSYSFSTALQDGYGLSVPARSSGIRVFDEYGHELQHIEQNVDYDLRQKSVRLFPRIQYKIDNDSALTASGSFSSLKSTNDGRTSYNFVAGPELPVSSLTTTGKNDATLSNTKVAGKTKIFGSISIEIDHSINSFSYDIYNSQVVFGSAGGLDYKSHTNSQMKDYGYSNTSKIRIPSFTSHDVIMGWELSESNATESRLERKQYQVAMNENFQQIRTKIRDTALFIQDEWQFDVDSSAYLGVRWEALKVESKGSLIEPLTHTSSVLSPILQTLWQLDSDNTKRIRLGISRNYKAPEKNSLVTTRWNRINNTIYTPNEEGNPLLKPELAWSLSAALEHEKSDDFSYAIRATVRSIENLQRERIFFADNLWWKTYVNSGDAVSQILEFETKFPLKNMLPKFHDLDMSFSLVRNWTKAIGQKSEADLLSGTKLMLNSNIDYRPNGKTWSTGVGIRYRQNIWKQESNVRQSYVFPPLEVDVYNLINLDKKTVLRLACDNLIKQRESNQDRIQYQAQITQRKDAIRPFRSIRIGLEHKF